MRGVLLMGIAAFMATPTLAAGERIRFWNLTANTITHFHLAPAGTNRYGPDQCANDRDGTVDHDERLRITGLPPGRYDAKLQDKTGRVCVVTNIDDQGRRRVLHRGERSDGLPQAVSRPCRPFPYWILRLFLSGATPAEALRNTLDLAQHAERWSYRRYRREAASRRLMVACEADLDG